MIMFLVSLVTGILLTSILSFDQGLLQLLLALLFVGIGLLLIRNSFAAYLLFTFLYPLVPSVPSQLGLPAVNFHEFLFLSFAFWWSVKKVGKKNIFREKPMAALIGLFLLFCAFSSFLSLLRTNLVFSNIFLHRISEKWNIFLPWSQLDSLATLRFLLNLLQGVLFFFITIDVLHSREKVIRALRILFSSAVCVSILGILQYIFEFRPLVPWSGEVIRVRVNSTFSDPNSLGTYLSGALLIGILTFVAVEAKKRWIHLVGTGLIFLSLIFTASRSAWGATALTLLLLLSITRLSRRSVTRFQDRSARMIAVGVALLIVALLAGLIVAVSMTGYRSQNSSLDMDSILMGRFSVWNAGLKIFSEHPVFGLGIGTFPQGMNKYQKMVPPMYAQENAHNYFLQLLAETGLIGFSLFLFILAKSFWHAIRFLRTAADSSTSWPVYALFSAIISVLLTSLTGHPLLLVKLQYFFWSLLGMLWILSGVPSTNRANFRETQILAGIVAVPILVLGPVELNSILKSRQVLPYEQGFHSWERDDSRIFRWTRESSLSRLRVEGKVLKIHLRQIHAVVFKKPTSVEIFVDGQLLDRITLTNTNWQELKYYLLGTKPDEVVTVGLQPDSVFNPSKIGISPDTRNLGVAVGPFEWESEVAAPIGVYEREKQQEGRFVWTRMQASFPLHQKGSTLQVPLFYNNPKLKDSIRILLYWNEALVKEAWVQNKGWQNLSLNLVSSPRQNGVLTVRVGQTWNPGKLGLNQDYRELGVGIRDFQWSK